MNFNAFDSATITICDWQGKVVWVSSKSKEKKIGLEIWKFVDPKNEECFRQQFSKAMNEEKCCSGTYSDDRGTAQVWMWSLGKPEAAVCMLTAFSPPELGKLTERELQYLPLLSKGYTTKELASELDLSLNTVHTQLRSIREKLGLPDLHKLICFATRYSGFINDAFTAV